MRVLGIDPGSVLSGYGIIDEEDDRLFYVASGIIAPSAKHPFPRRLKKIYDDLQKIIQRHHPTQAVVEDLFFAKNVQSALKLGQAKGVAVLAVMHGGIPVFEYSPTEVKQSVVGYGHADKRQVQQMVKTLLALKQAPRQPDATDALAVAICHFHHRRMREMLSKKVGSKE